MSQPNINVSQQSISMSQLSINVSQQSISVSRPSINVSQQSISVSQPSLNVSQQSITMSQPSINVSQKSISKSQPSINVSQKSISMSQPSINAPLAARFCYVVDGDFLLQVVLVIGVLCDHPGSDVHRNIHCSSQQVFPGQQHVPAVADVDALRAVHHCVGIPPDALL